MLEGRPFALARGHRARAASYVRSAASTALSNFAAGSVFGSSIVPTYGHGESPHGVLRTAYGLTKDKRWIRRVVEAQLEVNRVLGLMVALAVQQHEHEARGGGPAPPPEPPRCRIGLSAQPQA